MQGGSIKLLFSEEDRKKAAAKARKRDKALADKPKAKPNPKAKKAAVPATKVVVTRKTTESLLEEVEEVKKTNDREQEIIAAQMEDLIEKGIESRPLWDRTKKPDKIVAVRYLNNAKDLSLVESDYKMIVQIQESFERNVATALIQAAQMGKLLCHIKSLLKFGEFHKWCRKTLPFCIKTAQNYMLLHMHHAELLRKGVSSISEGYAAIKGEPAPDGFADVDDKTDYPKPTVEASVDLDEFPLPAVKATGRWQDLHIDKQTISDMRRWSNDCCVKILVKLPIDDEAEKLMGQFVVAAQRVLKPGGKLILHIPANRI